MSFIKSMHARYTTKMYDHSRKIAQSQLDELKEILRLCPSSINSQPWRFIFVSDAATKNELAKASYFNAEKVENCDTVVVFSRIDDVLLFENQLAATLHQGAVDYYNRFLRAQSDDQKKGWFGRQVYLALGVFLSACAEMKIDSTPLEGIECEKYNRILGLDSYCTLVAAAIGYRAEEDFNQTDKKPKSRKTLNQVIHSI